MPVGHKLIHAHDTAIDFECALMQLRKARDSNGLLIRLGPSMGEGHNPESMFRVLHDFVNRYGPNKITTYLKGDAARGIELDPDGELTFARNLQLLTNAYVAAVEHSRVVEYTNLKTPAMGRGVPS